LLGPGRFEISRAIVNNPYVAAWLGRERPGFQTLVAGDLDARAITSDALRFLSATGPCRSALYLHYLDTHTPYHPPPHYARKFIDRNAATTVGLTFDDVTGAWQGRYAAADRRRIADLYDGAIAWTDRQLGRLLRGLARRGLADRTIVVVTADHGEELWDHGQFFHGQSLYDELLHVPLIARVSAIGGGRPVAALVSTVDIVPTIVEAAGLPASGPSPETSRGALAGDGVSLQTLATGTAGGDAHARIVFATVSNADARAPPRQAVRSATAKLIRNVEDGTIEVYDLVEDPRERRNLGAAAPGAADLATALDAIRLRLAGRGWQLRLRSMTDRPLAYAVTLAGDPAVPIVEPDRLTLERGDRLRLGERSSTLTVAGTLEPGDDDRIRMDILAASGTLKVGITLDGAPAPAGTLRLGATRKPAGVLVDLADPALVGEPSEALGSVPSAAPSAAPVDLPRVTVALWRAAGEGAEGIPALDAASRERLRQLGYVE
ncbi:MAG: sulfatase family protein, partial [Candidatus Binatia bacterium]